MANGQLMKGIAIGFGAAVLVPVAVVTLGPLIRPVARSALKAGILAYERGREAAVELTELIDDLVAEVEDELREERQASTSASDPDTVAPPKTGATSP